MSNDTLGPGAWDERLKRGVEEFIDVNLVPAPPTHLPYRHAGILNFVFGHVWQRPGLTRRERRIITVACVALDDSPAGSALQHPPTGHSEGLGSLLTLRR